MNKKIILLCSPGFGIVDMWIPIISKLNKAGGVKIYFVFPEPSSLKLEDKNSNLFKISEKFLYIVIFKGHSGRWYKAKTLIEAQKGIKYSKTDDKLFSFAVRLFKGSASKVATIKFFGKLLLNISKFVAYIKESFGSLEQYKVSLLKDFDGVLFDVTVSRKKSNKDIMEATKYIPKFSMLHGLNAAWVEPEFNCEKSIKHNPNVTVYSMSHFEEYGYKKCYGILKKNIIHAGIPRHDKDWIDFIGKQSNDIKNKFNSYVFIIGRPASPYNTIERKKKVLRDVYNTVCVKYNLKLVVKPHPKESMEGIDGSIYKSALGEKNYGDNWIFSNSHPFVIGKDAIFCVSFYSGVVIDMLAINKPTIEYLNLKGLESYDNDKSLRDKYGNPVFPYRYTNLVFGVDCKHDFEKSVEDILTKDEYLFGKILSNYSNYYKPFDSSSKMVCDDILKKISI